jgi:hypothetical protein
MLIGQLPQNRRGLQMALPLWHARERTSQLSPDIQWRDTLVLCEGVQQRCLAGVGRPDEQDDLALQCSDFIDQTLKLFDHPRFPPDRTRKQCCRRIEG